MTARTKLPRPEEVQDFPVNKKAVLVREGGKIKVVEKKISWDEEKQCRVEKRTCLGYVVDGRFYSDENYRKTFKSDSNARSKRPSASRSKTAKSPGQQQNSLADTCGIVRLLPADAVPLLYAIAKDTGLVEDLNKTFGKTDANLMLSMAFLWLISNSHTPSFFSDWQTGLLLPYSGKLSDKKVASFLSRFADEPDAAEEFFLARLRRFGKKELLVYDATEIATAPQYTIIDPLWPDDDDEQKKENVILLLNHANHMPVLFKILPDNTEGICAVQDQIFGFNELNGQDKHISYAFIDIASFSLENLASFIDQKRRIAMPARYDTGGWIEEIINQARLTPPGGAGWEKEKECWHKSVPVSKMFPDGKIRKLWVHVYYSEKEKEIMLSQLKIQLSLFEDMWPWAAPHEDKSMDDSSLRSNSLMEFYVKGSGILGKQAPVRSEEAIASKTSDYGFFAMVSTMECSAADVLETFRLRSLIAQGFQSEPEPVYISDSITRHLYHADTLYGYMFISFLCLTILTHLENRMKLETVVTRDGKKKTMPPLSDEYSARDAISLFSSVSLAVYKNGTRQLLHAGQITQDLVQRLGYPDLFDTAIPGWT